MTEYLIIDQRSPVPPYVQIQEQIRARVAEGTLGAGDPLPSVRQLAADLGINPNTVAKAYMLLERERILETLPRRGTVIAAGAAGAVRRRAQDRLDAAVDQFLDQAGGLGLSGRQLLQAMKRGLQERGVDHPKRKDRR